MADNIQGFIKELAFEEALTHHLLDHGWNEVIKNPTEEQLVQNWADIIYDNNREIDKLGNYPLTASEMKQVMDQVNMKSSPYEMNRFINDIIKNGAKQKTVIMEEKGFDAATITKADVAKYGI